MNSNQRKAETLGMAHGTANNLLRRNIIFELLTTTWMESTPGICFRCEKLILSADEMSIDHKQPWEGRENGKELYWDIGNIAFSHRRCNKPHVRGNGSALQRKVGPLGLIWCAGHQEFLPKDQFHSNQSRWTGVAPDCRVCANKKERRGR